MDKKDQKIIDKAILQKLLVDPYEHLVSLKGTLKKFYKFRVGDYRLVCDFKENELIVMVIALMHRREIYDRLLK